MRHHERVDEDADILGLSAANAAAALSGAFVVNGSPTQTAMADLAGARSQAAQLAFAGIVLLVLLFFTGPLQYLPRSVLAGIVFTIAVGLVDLKSLRDIHGESPGEFKLAIVSAAVVALAGLEKGHFAGSRFVAAQACAPQLSSPFGGADAGRSRPLGSEAGNART